MTVADILRHGDFGLRTFNHLGGELVVLDGICYRLRADGTASLALGTDHTPFAAVTHFHPDLEITSEIAPLAPIPRPPSTPGSPVPTSSTASGSPAHSRTCTPAP